MMDTLYLDSPLGLLRLAGDGQRVCILEIADERGKSSPAPYLTDAAEQIEEFLAGTRRTLDFPIAPKGTVFQQKVWQALREIPYGKTDTYGSLAGRIGSPGAARAVGTAAGKNPILLAIPCHRLLGANGIGGFSCGIERKIWLLHLEQK